MTSSTETKEITIKEGTLIYLLLNGEYVGTVRCTKPGTYTIDKISRSHGTVYYKDYSTVQYYNMLQYNTWGVLEEDL